MKFLIASLVLVTAFIGWMDAQTSPADIVKRSVAVTERDWNAAPDWAFTERDVDSRHGKSAGRTYNVLMIDGSPYNMLVAVNDQPLPSADREKERKKLEREIQRRRSEDPKSRARRISSYKRERAQDHALLLEMMSAFTFTQTGVERIRNREAYKFDAVLRPNYVPKSREGKILTGMKGRLYIDKSTFHWVRVEAEVVKPVSFFGFLAKVEPGTRFVLEQAPVKDDLWLPVRFREIIHVQALGILGKQKDTEERYSDYRPMRDVFASLEMNNQTAAP